MSLLTTAINAGVAATQGNPLGVVNALAAPITNLFDPANLPQLTPAQAAQLAANRAAKLSPADQQLYTSLVSLRLQAQRNTAMAGNLPVINAAINVLQDRLYSIVPDANSSDISILQAYSGSNTAALASFARVAPVATVTTPSAPMLAPVKGAAVPSQLGAAVSGTATTGTPTAPAKTTGPAPVTTPMASVAAANAVVPAILAPAPLPATANPIPSMGLQGTPPSSLAALVNQVLPAQAPTMPPARSVVSVGPTAPMAYSVIPPSAGAQYPDDDNFDDLLGLPSSSPVSSEIGPDTTPRMSQNLMVLAAVAVVLVVVMRHV